MVGCIPMLFIYTSTSSFFAHWCQLWIHKPWLINCGGYPNKSSATNMVPPPDKQPTDYFQIRYHHSFNTYPNQIPIKRQIFPPISVHPHKKMVVLFFFVTFPHQVVAMISKHIHRTADEKHVGTVFSSRCFWVRFAIVLGPTQTSYDMIWYDMISYEFIWRFPEMGVYPNHPF